MFWDIVNNSANSSERWDSGSRTYFMPVSIRNPRKQRFISGPVGTPAAVSPFDESEESALVCCLIGEISGLLSLKLDNSPSFARGGAAPPCEHAIIRAAYVGASHVSRMLAPATASDVTEDIQLPRWASDSDTVSLITEKVTELKLTANDALVLDIFSNMAFMGTDPDGLPARPHRGMDGRFHITGHLEGATTILLKTNLAASVPVISASNGAKVVFVLPTPRYLTSPCCSNTSHLVNREEADFSSIVMAVSQSVKAVLEAEITKKGWPAVIFDPMSSFEVSEDPAKTTSSSGMSIWLPKMGCT
jgi:hypothetical protein